MDTKEQILDLYYNKHLKQNEISKIVGKSSPYISKIVKTDKQRKKNYLFATVFCNLQEAKAK